MMMKNDKPQNMAKTTMKMILNLYKNYGTLYIALLWYQFQQMSIFITKNYHKLLRWLQAQSIQGTTPQTGCKTSFFSSLSIITKTTRIKRKLQRNEQINRERYIIRNRTQLQNHIQSIINLTKLSIRRFIGLVEGNQVKHILDIDIALKLVYVHSDQNDVVV